MFLNRARALASLGAQIKASLLLNLDKLARHGAAKANFLLDRLVEKATAKNRTPGAFGSARPSTRFKPGTGQPGMWKYCQARGKVRGY